MPEQKYFLGFILVSADVIQSTEVTKWKTWKQWPIYSAGPSFINLLDAQMKGWWWIRHPDSLTLYVLCVYIT